MVVTNQDFKSSFTPKKHLRCNFTKQHVKFANIDLGSNNIEPKKNKITSIGKKLLILLFASAGVCLADLFLAKGKAISSLTRGKISFIKTMSDDIENAVKCDNFATKGRFEAFFSTPGLHAVWSHRINHKLYNWKIPVIPRLLSNIARFITGIEIHPGAKLGKQLFIDHTGAIIGQTAEIGDRVKIIGRTVLGSTGKDGFLRHPIIGNDVTICMNSSLLGPVKIADRATIGAGSIITYDVPSGATVIGIGNKAQIIRWNRSKLSTPILLKDFNKKRLVVLK